MFWFLRNLEHVRKVTLFCYSEKIFKLIRVRVKVRFRIRIRVRVIVYYTVRVRVGLADIGY